MAIVLTIFVVVVPSTCSATLPTWSIVNLVEVVGPIMRRLIRPLRFVTFGSITSVSVVSGVTIVVVVLVVAVAPRPSLAHLSVLSLRLFQVVFCLLLFGLVVASGNLVEPRIRNLVSLFIPPS